MKALGTIFALVSAALGTMQVWAGTRRHADEFSAARGSARTFFSYEFAGSPARLRELITAAGDRGREAIRRCLELGYLITAGYVFMAVGIGGILTAVNRTGLGRMVLVCGLLAALFDLIGSSALRQAVQTHPAGGSTAPIAAVATGMKFVLLAFAAAGVFLWPIRTWF